MSVHYKTNSFNEFEQEDYLIYEKDWQENVRAIYYLLYHTRLIYSYQFLLIHQGAIVCPSILLYLKSDILSYLNFQGFPLFHCKYYLFIILYI